MPVTRHPAGFRGHQAGVPWDLGKTLICHCTEPPAIWGLCTVIWTPSVSGQRWIPFAETPLRRRDPSPAWPHPWCPPRAQSVQACTE